MPRDEQSITTVISSSARQTLSNVFHQAVTDVSLDRYDADGWHILESSDPRLGELGITFETGSCRIALRRLDQRLGDIRVNSPGDNNAIILDNDNWSGFLSLHVRMPASNCTVVVNLHGAGPLNIRALLRSDDNLFYWGKGSTAVGANFEIHGTSRALIVGDDALMSSGVWFRNFDMHSIVDLDSMEQINHPVDMVVERHVWIGQDALILSCQRVGKGAIIGAKSLVKRDVPPLSCVGGIPAKVIRERTSWGRRPTGMNPAERASLGL